MDRVIPALRWFPLVALLALTGTDPAQCKEWPSCLPEVPEESDTPGVWTSIILQERNYPVLPVKADLRRPGRSVIVDDPEAICSEWTARRRVLKLDRPLVDAVNRELSGEEWPILEGLASLLLDRAVPGAGTILTIFETAVKATERDPDVRARLRDEIWRVDFMGCSEDGEPVYVVYTVLLDPFREETWLLNEQRFSVSGPAREDDEEDGSVE
jgi:hypothetical protein